MTMIYVSILGGGGVTTCTTMINDHQNCIDSDILTMSNLYGRYWGLSISGVTEVIHIGQSQVIKGYVVCKVDKKNSYIHVLCLSKNKYIHTVDMATDGERHR